MDILESLCGGIFIKKINIMELNKINFGADRYYKAIKKSKIICVDFDNTVCLDEWPYIGPIIPGSIEVLKSLENNGHKLILYTQRNKYYPICCQALYEYSNHCMSEVDILTPAINIFEENDIKLFGINANTLWEDETKDNSRKVYMDYLIDDHVIGTERLKVTNKFGEVCNIVDWFLVDRWCVNEGLYEKYAIKYTHEEYKEKIKNLY